MNKDSIKSVDVDNGIVSDEANTIKNVQAERDSYRKIATTQEVALKKNEEKLKRIEEELDSKKTELKITKKALVEKDKELEIEKKALVEKDEESKWRKYIFTGVLVVAFISLMLLIYALSSSSTMDATKNTQLRRLTSEALLTSSSDNTTAIRIAEAACKMGSPDPPDYCFRALSAVGYSSIGNPFYTTVIAVDNGSPVQSAIFSPYKDGGKNKDGDRILTISNTEKNSVARLWERNGEYVNKLEHDGRITFAVFSSNGKRILTASWDKTAKLWDREGRCLKIFKHSARVYSALFLAEDSSRILTASGDGLAKLWDDEGKHICDFKGHTGAVTSAVPSSDGSLILTASWDNSVKLWDLSGNELAHLAHENIDPVGKIQLVLFAPGEPPHRILTVWDENVTMWSTAGQIQNNFFFKEKDNVVSAVFSTDGKKLLIASKSGVVRLLNLEDKTQVELCRHRDKISTAVFSHDGSQILTASFDKSARLWDLEGALVAEFKHRGEVTSAVFSPSGQHVLTASEDGTAKVWPLENEIIIDVGEDLRVVTSAAFSPKEKILTVSDDGIAKLWDFKGVYRTEVCRHNGKIKIADFSPDGNKILTVSDDEIAKLWDVKGESCLDLNDNSDGSEVSFAMFLPGGKEILMVTPIGNTQVSTLKWLTVTGKLMRERTVTTPEKITAIPISTDGSRLLTVVPRPNAKLWNPKEGSEARFMKELEHGDTITAAAISSQKKLILTASRDHTASLWDWDGIKKCDFRKHKGAISSAVFSPDGNRVLTTSEDGTAKLWDLGGNLLADLDKHDGPVLSAVFSANGKRIVTASKDGTAKLWDSNGRLFADLDKNTGPVLSAAISPDSKRILTVSKGGTAKVWLSPLAILEWLKKSKPKLPPLTKKDKAELGIK